MRLALAALVCVCAISWSTVAAAQVGSGAITGIVADQQGAPIPGVTVTVTDIATGRQHATATNQDGVFAEGSLAPGDYRLDVSLGGFKPVARTGLRVVTGETV